MDRAYALGTSAESSDEDRFEREAIARIAHQFFDLSDVRAVGSKERRARNALCS
jgi:hypothetical protein